MRRRSFVRKFLSAEFVLMWLLGGTVSIAASSSSIYKPSSNYLSLTLVSLLLPWTVSGKGAQDQAVSSTIQIVDTVVADEAAGRGIPSSFFSRSGQSSSGNNELLANIDFLTQLTNSKQGKESEMDPLKCFPKALCGLSAESAAITRKRKNGLITDYIRLMKAVALNPSVMEKTMKKLKRKQEVPLDDAEGDESESDEDEEEDEEDDYREERRADGLSKRTALTGYGYGSAKEKPSKKSRRPSPTKASPTSSSSTSTRSSKKRSKKEREIPKNSKEFTKQFLNEKAHVEKLMEDGFYNEETDAQNWWAYEHDMEKEPSLEDLVDDGKDNSVEPYYTFGGKRKPDPPMSPYRPEPPPQPPTPNTPFIYAPQSPPPKPRPPQAPSVRVPPGGEGSGTTAAIGNFFRNLFGFGNSQGNFQTDPFFQGFQRSLADGTPTLVTVDRTKEILTTAIEIGETLRSPNQCNTLFNGCKYQYIELLHVIDDIRQSLADKGKIDFQTDGFATEEEAENDSNSSSGTKVGKRRRKDKNRSYGYQSSLSETSQAETLSPDYTAAASQVVKKGRRRSGKRRKNSRSQETGEQPSSEIASDEPTMYGSSLQPVPIPDTRHKDGRHDGHGNSNQYHYDHTAPQLQHHGYHNSYYSQFDNSYDRQPKGWWGTILSWFGFGRK